MNFLHFHVTVCGQISELKNVTWLIRETEEGNPLKIYSRKKTTLLPFSFIYEQFKNRKLVTQRSWVRVRKDTDWFTHLYMICVVDKHIVDSTKSEQVARWCSNHGFKKSPSYKKKMKNLIRIFPIFMWLFVCKYRSKRDITCDWFAKFEGMENPLKIHLREKKTFSIFFIFLFSIFETKDFSRTRELKRNQEDIWFTTSSSFFYPPFVSSACVVFFFLWVDAPLRA